MTPTSLVKLTIADRVKHYAMSDVGRKYQSSQFWLTVEQGHVVAYARWVLGNDYRNKTPYYGAFPPGFLERLRAFFPDIADVDVLHAFSGSLPAGEYTRCDANPDNGAELVCRVEDLPARNTRRWPLVVADPPYSASDAEKYGLPMVNRLNVTEALAQVVPAGGHLAWLDTVWPMHRSGHWSTVARISITRSTNHRLRDCTIFERTSKAYGYESHT